MADKEEKRLVKFLLVCAGIVYLATLAVCIVLAVRGVPLNDLAKIQGPCLFVFMTLMAIAHARKRKK